MLTGWSPPTTSTPSTVTVTGTARSTAFTWSDFARIVSPMSMVLPLPSREGPPLDTNAAFPLRGTGRNVGVALGVFVAEYAMRLACVFGDQGVSPHEVFAGRHGF